MRVEGRAGQGRRRTRVVGVIAAAAVAAGSRSRGSARRRHGPGSAITAIHGDDTGKLLFFASDGLRQDAVEEYADDGDTPGFRELLRKGTHASGQRPADPGAAEHRRRLVHARDRRLAGRPRLDQQHVPHQRQPSASGDTQTFSPSRTAAFDNGVLQAETLAQSAERGGKKVAQIEWAGGRGGAINGPTLDFRNFRSGRGVATNYIAPEDSRARSRVVRPAVRPPGRVRRQRPVPAGGADRRHRLDERAALLQPGQGDAPARARRPDAERASTSTASTPTSTTAATTARRAMTACCSARTKSGADAVGDLEEGEWADVKVTIDTSPTDALNGKTGAFLVKVERLDARPLAGPPLPHQRHARDRDLAGWTGEPGFTGTFEDFVAERFPSSQAGDFAVLEAGIVSEETYIEQGEYWEKLLPPADQVRARQVPAGPGDGRLPGHRRGPAPVPRPGHQEAAQRRRQPVV